ncbi:MAG: hypothetical protein AB1505_22135 [Candidatus Latescibacterota bacterium]
MSSRRTIHRPGAGFCAVVVMALVLLSAGRGWAQQDVVVSTAATGLTGATHTLQGAEVVIYTIGLQDNLPPTRVNDLGHNTVVTNRGIQLTISDLTSPTGLASSDFTELRLYRSSDATFDGADVQMATTGLVNVGAITELDVTGLALGGTRRIDAPPAETFYIVTAVISPTAVNGRSFRLGAAANHVGIYESGFPAAAGDYGRGAVIWASDGNYIVIGAEVPEYLTRRGGTIPFGGEPALLVLLLGTGAWLLRRRAAA